MNKIISIVLSSAVFAVASVALAATPNNQACVGKDFSSYARNGNSTGLLVFDSGSGFGKTIVFIAQDFGGTGVGPEIQNHMAGLVPDSVLPNSCNN